MKLNSDFRDLLLAFNEESVEYLLVGGFAVILHSEPRYTKDIDLWINPTEENSQRVYRALIKFGAPLPQLQLTEEDFKREDYFVQLGKEPARVDILTGISGLSFADAWSKREVMVVTDVPITVISREDLIAAKLEAGRPQDLIDASALKKSKRK